MLTGLSLDNFKCFTSLRLELRPLTLLTGYNGAGKSTSIQPLLLLAQAERMRDSDIPLNGPLVRLGSAGDIITPSGNPRFTLEGPLGSTEWQLKPKLGHRTLYIETQTKRNMSTDTALNNLIYLTAIRPGVLDVYPSPDSGLVSVGDVGDQGQFAPYWYNIFADDPADLPQLTDRKAWQAFRKQIDILLSRLFPTAQANVTEIPQATMYLLRFRLGDSSEWRRPANIGFGLSYAFPILVALLTITRDKIILIDSPEAHLHPSAQSEMGRMIAQMCSKGRQAIIETHSDHLLNGIRLAVKEGLIRPEDVAIHFFSGVTHQNHGVTSPRIDHNGNLSDWPEGFFDQTERDLLKLSDWS